jgi:hypothetical protein
MGGIRLSGVDRKWTRSSTHILLGCLVLEYTLEQFAVPNLGR